MEVIHAKCAGLDVHKETVVACVRLVRGGQIHQEVRTFSTVTKSLYDLAAWLASEEVTAAAMEATGVYWKPVWHVLEASGLTPILANAAHIKSVPGRKTDVNDATWIADLLAHGLIRGSFVPERPIQELRDLTRTRKQFVRERTQHVQRIHKVLEDANVKITSVITDIMGRSGRSFLSAIIAGEADPERLAQLGSTRLRATHEQLAEALRGHVTPHHRFMLKFYLGQVEGTDLAIAELDTEVAALLQPFHDAVINLTTVPGIAEIAATAIISEIGIDMSHFPSADHLVSWATLCPRNDESAGRRRSTRIRKGASWLKPLLVQAAWSAVRKKNSYERSLFLRLKARRGPQKAIVAVAASMLRAIYHILRNGVPYRDLGPNHFDTITREHSKMRLVRRLQALGYDVEVKEVA